MNNEKEKEILKPSRKTLHNSQGINILSFCKTTKSKCKYYNMPTCNFYCVGDTAEDGNKRVCRRNNCKKQE